MNIENLTAANVRDVEEIGKAFTREVEYPGGFDIDAFARTWGQMLRAKIGEIYVTRVGDRIAGLFGAVFTTDTFNGAPVAMENFWYVLEEYRSTTIGIRLLNHFEQEAKRRGCKRILMVHLSNSKAEALEKLYIHRGFTPIEKTFSKEI